MQDREAGAAGLESHLARGGQHGQGDPFIFHLDPAGGTGQDHDLASPGDDFDRSVRFDHLLDKLVLFRHDLGDWGCHAVRARPDLAGQGGSWRSGRGENLLLSRSRPDRRPHGADSST